MLHNCRLCSVKVKSRGRVKQMKFEVTFTQYYTYEVEAESEDEAVSKAHRQFESDMRSPIANTAYDYVDVEEVEQDN